VSLGTPFFIIAYFLPFGLALVAPAVDFFVAGAAFLAVAFVAILVKCISPSQWSGTLSPKKLISNHVFHSIITCNLA
jgi:hypothetical protein